MYIDVEKRIISCNRFWHVRNTIVSFISHKTHSVTALLAVVEITLIIVFLTVRTPIKN